MSGDVKKVLQKFHHQPPKPHQFSPFYAALYAKSIKGKHQYAPQINSYSLLPPSKITRVQQILGRFLYYARAIDNTLLPALNTIAEKQAAATKQMEDQYHSLLDYVSTQPNVSLRFYKIDMVLTI